MADSGCCPPTPTDHYNTKRVFYHLKGYMAAGVSGEAPQVDVGTNPDWYTVIDVATLTQDLKPVQQNEAYVINLEVIDISFSTFQQLFYPTFGEFIPNKNLYNTEYYKYINNTARKVIQVCDDHRGLLEPTFNLYNELVKAYELTLGVKSECWLPCSLTKLHSSVAKVNNLLDKLLSLRLNHRPIMNGTKLKSHLGQSEIGIKGAIESISGRLQNLKENQRKE